jgi:magnesium transporter
LLDDEQPAIDVEESSGAVARQFSDHDWISAPVVDENNILLGRITIDDVVDIIREQAEHQALGAAGLDEDEDLFSPVKRATRRRLLWLTINLGTAFLASAVVGQFQATIAHIVALAVLMPIVAGMGGNAGTQVLALVVRGLALGQLGASNVQVLIWKEIRVALLNGIALGNLVGRDRVVVVRRVAARTRDRECADDQPVLRGPCRRDGAGDAQAHGDSTRRLRAASSSPPSPT